MKNYLFFPEKYQNWTINIQDLERKTHEIQIFYQLFHPRYNLRKESLFDTTKHEIKYYLLKPHNYVYIQEENYKLVFKDKTDPIDVPVGSILVSNALNEGQKQYNNSNDTGFETSIQNDFNYYFIQPLGGACYYLWKNGLNVLHALYSDASKNYGLTVSLNFTLMNIRWVCMRQNSSESGFSIPEDEIGGGNVSGTAWSKKLYWNAGLDNEPFVSIKYNNEEIISDYHYFTQGSNFTIQHNSADGEVWPGWMLEYTCY